MTNATLLQSLSEAGEGSRELDANVWAAVNGYELFEHDGAGWRYRMHPTDTLRHERTGYISPFTTSLDAALALAERVLPGWRVYGISDETEFQVPSGWGAGVCEWRGPGVHYARGSTPALALCIAILKAQSPEPNKDNPSNREGV